MSYTDPISPAMAEKVHRLLEQNRVLLVTGHESKGALVVGDEGVYTVRAFKEGVQCECVAGTAAHLCSHKLAAMAVWADALVDPFSGVLP